jgi:hypothetical protein
MTNIEFPIRINFTYNHLGIACLPVHPPQEGKQGHSIFIIGYSGWVSQSCNQEVFLTSDFLNN